VVAFPETCEIQLVAQDGAIGFAVGSAAVSPEGEANLATIASRLAGAATVDVVGHTSSEGDPAFNQTLSEDRATAVRTVLEQLVPGAAFSSAGRGFSEPVLGPDGTEDRVASRRVVITAQVPEEQCSTLGS
jgi:outer membrane protein OmpA-like peptidoglycan-associated protein